MGTQVAAVKSAVPVVPATEVAMGLIVKGDNSSRRMSGKEDEGEVAKLAANIKAVGLIQPITVKPKNKEGKYELLAGYRRLEAVKSLGWKSVPVRILETAADPKMVNLFENLKRKNISAVEFAMAVRDIAKANKWKLPWVDGVPVKGKTQFQVAEVCKALGGVSAALVTEHLLLLKLPEAVQKKVHLEELASRGAFELAKMDISEETMEKVMTVAEELQEEKAEKAAKAKAAAAKAEGKTEKRPVPEASKATVAAAKREKAKRVEAATVKKAAAKVAASKKEEAKGLAKAGRVAEAKQAEKEAAEIAKAASKSGGAGRVLGDWTDIVALVKGENEGCDEFAELYASWLKGEVESDEMVGYLVGALKGKK